MDAQTGGIGRPRVLLVDDDPAMVELLSLALGGEGCDVVVVGDAYGARKEAHRQHPDAIVLDLDLPGPDGPQVLSWIRSQLPTVPVLVLTARDSLDDWLDCVTRGAADYLTKPFSLQRLIDRVGRLLPRPLSDASLSSTTLAVADLILDERSRRVHAAGEPIEIDATAFDVLRYLMRHAGQSLSAEQVLQAVWNFDFGGDTKVADLYVNYLRARIEPISSVVVRATSGRRYLIEPREQP